MGSQHIYYDNEVSVDKAKAELLELRQGDNEAAKQSLVNQFEAPRGKRKQNIAQKVLYNDPLDETLVDTLARNVSIIRQLRSDYSRLPFETALHKELSIRQLAFTDSYMHQQGYDEFNAKDLFTQIGVGNGRLLFSSSPVILPFHAPEEICYTHDRPNPDKKLVTFGRPGKIEGLYSTLALVSVDLKNQQGDNQLGLVSVILIDPKVMNAVRDLSQSGHTDIIKNAAKRLMPGLKSLNPYGMHDYVHQMILPITDPQTMNLRLDGDYAPFRNFRLEERSAEIAKNHNFRENADIIAYTSNQYELHAELVNRDVWRQAFRDNPKVHKGPIWIATQFLHDLETVRDALTNNNQETLANALTCLMLEIGSRRFLRVIDIRDPALETKMSLRTGEKLSFIEACEALNMPPLEVCETRARSWRDNLRLNEVVKPGIVLPENPTLLQIFIDNPGRFPKLSEVVSAAVNDKKATHHLTGLENVVARGFGGAGLVLNVAALMCDFPEGKGPIYNTPGLLEMNRSVMTTASGGMGPIPENLYDAMRAYHAAISSNQTRNK